MTARKCPVCGKAILRAPDDVRPFCSPSCKLADLGRWLDGSYRIAGPPLEIENESFAVMPSKEDS
ncbi:MAG: DNA gyrase inhibitor YacG [Polyangiaceae bacterium]|nr:DNA gyrase inhibitor YacG [Polyangiaceae bacterium]